MNINIGKNLLKDYLNNEYSFLNCNTVNHTILFKKYTLDIDYIFVNSQLKCIQKRWYKNLNDFTYNTNYKNEIKEMIKMF